jgi:hypothetical protein
MCAHLRKEFQTLDDTAIEVNQFGFGEVVDVGGHDQVSSNQFVVVSMAANPEPNQAILGINGQCAVMQTDTSRPIAPNMFEMQGRVFRVCFQ